MKPYIFFDAGGTLLFPKFDWLSSLLSSKGIDVKSVEIFEAFSLANYQIDVALRNGENDPWWNGGLSGFARWLFSKFNVREEIMDELVNLTVKEDKEKGLWSYAFNWTKPTLEKLKKRGYSMSVISNSDGRVENMIKEVGLREYFDKVYDSYIVGFSKPDPRIYKLALDELHLKPQNSLFIGDIFYIDVFGANAVGIPAVHLDPFGYYKQWPGVRIKNVAELPNLLENFSNDVVRKDFFPFDTKIS